MYYGCITFYSEAREKRGKMFSSSLLDKIWKMNIDLPFPANNYCLIDE